MGDGPPAPAVQPPPAELVWGPLLQGHPLAHIVYDPRSLRLLACNAAAVARYGHSPDALLHMTRADLLLAAELPRLHAFLAALPAGEHADNPQHVWLERTRDGRVLHADVRSMAVLFEGQPAQLAVVVDAGPHARPAGDAGQTPDLLVVAGRMAQLGGWSIDLARQRVQWSDGACAIHEVPPGTEHPIDQAWAFYPGAAADTVRDAVQRCANDGVPFDLELPLIGARGSARWVRMLGAPVRDASGATVGIDGALQDITQAKRAALALDESHARMAALLRGLPDLWVLFDAEDRYVDVGDPQHPLLSGAWDDRRGRRIDEVLEQRLARRLRWQIEQAHAKGATHTYHYQVAVRNGQRRSLEGRCVPLKARHTLMLIRDVTEAAQHERLFHAMADAAPIAIFMTDAQGGCTYTNAAWHRLVGISFEGSLGDGWVAGVHPDDRDRVRAAWAGQTRHDDATPGPQEMEFRVVTSWGSTRTVAALAGPIVRADGETTGHVGAVVDLTHERELEQARRAQAVAEESGRRQSAFMSRVSHELRTPLNAILGFGQLLQQDPALRDSRAQRYAAHVVNAGQHMLALVDDLLELQRLETGRTDLVLTDIDVGALFVACADLLRPMADAAAIELLLTVPPGLVLRSDDRCLRQVLLNLGSNAIKYGRPAAGGDAAVRTTIVMAAERSATAIELSVTDHGPGMTPAQLQRLFQPFERLGQEAGGQPGSGLGLVITRQLAQLLGGDVTLRSEPGRGTTATLQLPAASCISAGP